MAYGCSAFTNHFIFIFSSASFSDQVLKKGEGVWNLPLQLLHRSGTHMGIIRELLESANLETTGIFSLLMVDSCFSLLESGRAIWSQRLTCSCHREVSCFPFPLSCHSSECQLCAYFRLSCPLKFPMAGALQLFT